MNKEKIGAFILENRKALGLTQEELAQKLFVTNKAVSKWEKGQSFPDIAMFEPLAAELGVTVSELIAGEREAAADVTVKELATEIFRKEKVKFILETVIVFLAVALLIGGIYAIRRIEGKNYDYVCINGFYYTFDLESPMYDETFIGEYLGEVKNTEIRRNTEFNRHGDSNVYPIGAKIYSTNEENPAYDKIAWRVGTSLIEIDGTYYLGWLSLDTIREHDMYNFANGLPVGYKIGFEGKYY